MLGVIGETRGSYVCSECTTLPAALDGALMKEVNVRGHLKAAADGYAIYISDNAHVEEINILPGAKIEGKIQSDWNRYLALETSTTADTDDSQEEYRTALNFGSEDKNGLVDYAYEISGSKSIELNIVGGQVNFTGKAEVLNVTVEKDGVLSGAAHYILTSKESEVSALSLDDQKKELGVFLNKGTLKADNLNGIPEIQGDYIQENTGVLQLSVNDEGALIQLPVSGEPVIKGGTLSILPDPGFYETLTPVSIENLTTSDKEDLASNLDYKISPDFSSPTFSFVAEPSDQG